MNGASSTKTSVKVFGGIPPEVTGPEGFGAWSSSVRDFPMPVRYSLTSNYVVLKHIPGIKFGFQDFNAASDMYIKYAQAVAKPALLSAKEVVAAEEAHKAKEDGF